MAVRHNLLVASALGAVVGAVAVQGLHAQAKKTYVISELQTLDEGAARSFAPKAEAAQAKAGAHSFQLAGGKVASIEGDTPPPRVALTEWPSLEAAQTFYKSAAWTDMKAERDKAVRTIRRYAVEAR